MMYNITDEVAREMKERKELQSMRGKAWMKRKKEEWKEKRVRVNTAVRVFTCLIFVSEVAAQGTR